MGMALAEAEQVPRHEEIDDLPAPVGSQRALAGGTGNNPVPILCLLAAVIDGVADFAAGDGAEALHGNQIRHASAVRSLTPCCGSCHHHVHMSPRGQIERRAREGSERHEEELLPIGLRAFPATGPALCHASGQSCRAELLVAIVAPGQQDRRRIPAPARSF